MFGFLKSKSKKEEENINDNIVNDIDSESNIGSAEGLTEEEIYELGLKQYSDEEIAKEKEENAKAEKKIRIEKNPKLERPASRIKPLPKDTERYNEISAKLQREIEENNKQKELEKLRMKKEASSREIKYIGGLKGYSDFELTKAFNNEYRRAYRGVMASKDIGDKSELRAIVEEAKGFGVDEGLLQNLTNLRKRVEGKTFGQVAGRAIKGTARAVKEMPRVGASGMRAVSGVGRQLSRPSIQPRSFGSPMQGQIRSADPTKILDAGQAMGIFATPRVRVHSGIISRTVNNPIMNIPQSEGYLQSIGRNHRSPVRQMTDNSWIQKIIGV